MCLFEDQQRRVRPEWRREKLDLLCEGGRSFSRSVIPLDGRRTPLQATRDRGRGEVSEGPSSTRPGTTGLDRIPLPTSPFPYHPNTHE